MTTSGAYGVNFHDNDLVPASASTSERDSIVKEFKEALDAAGLTVPMATTNLTTDPIFKDGAFTSPDARVRAYALLGGGTDSGVCRSRRHSKDYEYLPESSEALIYTAMIRLMLTRLSKYAV